MPQARRIWLTRHGESMFNVKHLLGGNAELSARGMQYALALPSALQSRTSESDIQTLTVWTSTLKRTILTAQNLPYPKTKFGGLDEINAGLCDGMTYKDVEEQMPLVYEARTNDKLNYRYPKGESYMDLVIRLQPIVRQIQSSTTSVCIVAHQAVLRVVYGLLLDLPLEKLPSLPVPLHTLIELTPLPGAGWSEVRVPVDVSEGAGASWGEVRVPVDVSEGAGAGWSEVCVPVDVSEESVPISSPFNGIMNGSILQPPPACNEHVREQCTHEPCSSIATTQVLA
eukprot:gene81-12904_t